MTSLQLNSTWHTIKGKLKQRYGQLTDADLTFAEGKGEELLGRLQEKLGLSRAELDSTLDDLAPAAEGNLGHAEATAGEVSDRVRAKAGQVVDDLRQGATAVGEEAKAQGAAAYGEARQCVRGLLDDGEEYVRKNPRESVLVAVTVGFLAGIMLVRR